MSNRAIIEGVGDADGLGELQAELDGLAECFGVELRMRRDDEAPLLWAVWHWSPDCQAEADAEIIGAADHPLAAIEEAREQLLTWERGGALVARFADAAGTELVAVGRIAVSDGRHVVSELSIFEGGQHRAPAGDTEAAAATAALIRAFDASNSGGNEK